MSRKTRFFSDFLQLFFRQELHERPSKALDALLYEKVQEHRNKLWLIRHRMFSPLCLWHFLLPDGTRFCEPRMMVHETVGSEDPVGLWKRIEETMCVAVCSCGARRADSCGALLRGFYYFFLLFQKIVVLLQIENIYDMETQVAYTRPLESTDTRTRKSVKSARTTPEGYMSLDEFGSIFHRKLDEAYAKLHGDSEQ